LVTTAPLFISLPVAAKREDVEHRQRAFDGRLADEQIPDIAVVQNAGGNRFGTVEHRSAAYAEDGFHPVVASRRDGFTNLRENWIADNAAALDETNVVRGQVPAHDGKETIALDPIAAIAEQHFTDAMLGQMLADQLFLASAEFDFRRIEKREVVHLNVLGNGLPMSMDCTLVPR
jgi:hypothetical protein